MFADDGFCWWEWPNGEVSNRFPFFVKELNGLNYLEASSEDGTAYWLYKIVDGHLLISTGESHSDRPIDFTSTKDNKQNLRWHVRVESLG